MFYRYVDFDALVFVVSVQSSLRTSREWIRRLLNEEELRETQIVVVVNTFGQIDATTQQQAEAVIRSLGLEEMKSTMPQGNAERLMWCTVNCQAGEKDPQWAGQMERLLNRMEKRYTAKALAAAKKAKKQPVVTKPTEQAIGQQEQGEQQEQEDEQEEEQE